MQLWKDQTWPRNQDKLPSSKPRAVHKNETGEFEVDMKKVAKFAQLMG